MNPQSTLFEVRFFTPTTLPDGIVVSNKLALPEFARDVRP